MANIMWKGDDSDLKEITWRHTTFKKGEAVKVTDPQTITKAQVNPAYSVELEKGDLEQENPTVPAPSEISAQLPVAKPGEPLNLKSEPPPKPPSEETVVEPLAVRGIPRSVASARTKK